MIGAELGSYYQLSSMSRDDQVSDRAQRTSSDLTAPASCRADDASNAMRALPTKAGCGRCTAPGRGARHGHTSGSMHATRAQNRKRGAASFTSARRAGTSEAEARAVHDGLMA
jgi:hypothetical protein